MPRVRARCHLNKERVSRGTETSKYPEERKSTETPLVAASEKGPAQTGADLKDQNLMSAGGCRA